MNGGISSVGSEAKFPKIIVNTREFKSGWKMYQIGPNMVCL